MNKKTLSRGCNPNCSSVGMFPHSISPPMKLFGGGASETGTLKHGRTFDRASTAYRKDYKWISK